MGNPGEAAQGQPPALEGAGAALRLRGDLAFHSGFSGQRAVRTWKERIKALDGLGFIRTAAGTAGPYSHAVILNPHFVIRRLYAAKTPGLTAASYNALADGQSTSPRMI